MRTDEQKSKHASYMNRYYWNNRDQWRANAKRRYDTLTIEQKREISRRYPRNLALVRVSARRRYYANLDVSRQRSRDHQREFRRNFPDRARAIARAGDAKRAESRKVANLTPEQLQRRRAIKNASARKNRSKHVDYRKAYALKNKDRRNLTRRLWRKSIADKKRAFEQSQPGYRVISNEEKREIRLSNKRLWYRAHREDSIRTCRAYYQKNREKVEAAKKAWRVKNIEKSRLSARKSAAKNKERRKIYKKQWLKLNPDKRGFHEAARQRAKRSGVVPNDNAKAFYKFVRSKVIIPCYYCGNKVSGKEAHIDHVIALSKSGNHASDNLCASCPSCNLRKGARLPSDITFVNQPLLNL